MAKNVARGRKQKKKEAEDAAAVEEDEEDAEQVDGTEADEDEDDGEEEEEEEEEGEEDEDGDDEEGEEDADEEEEEEEEEEDEEDEEVTDVPAFLDKDDVLVPLKKMNFPKTLEGRKAFCDYNIEKWKLKKSKIEDDNDPKKKAKNKLARYKKMIATLEAEISGDEDEDESEE